MSMYLDNFNITVEKDKDTDHYKVIYFNESCSGTCVYDYVEKVGKNKPIRQNFYVMVDCHMGDVIDYINKERELGDDDLIKLQREIREDSLSRVKDVG